MTELKIEGFSFGDFFWTEVKKNRVSFSFQGLPKGVHFTIAWNPSGKMNLHVSKNIGDDNNKPKIVIAYFDRSLLDTVSEYLSSIFFGQYFNPSHLKSIRGVFERIFN